MRLLGLFIGTVAGLLMAVMILNWWVDPFGEYYDEGPLETALVDPRACLISAEIVGQGSPDAVNRFRGDLIDSRRPATVAVGTSRIQNMHSWPGETDFANLGIPNYGVDALPSLFSRLRARSQRPLTVYLGVELFWLNGRWTPWEASVDRNLLDKAEYLLARQTLSASLRLVLDAPSVLIDQWTKRDVGPDCLLDRGSRITDGKADAWHEDGSFESRWELTPHVARPPGDDFREDFVTFSTGYYRAWDTLDPDRLAVLEEALEQAAGYGWNVVGFAAPYSERYVERLSRGPDTGPEWSAFGPAVRAVFRRHGFAFVDLRRGSDVPCADDEFDFGNDGWHPTRACSMRVRAQLDEAADRRASG